MTNRKRHQKQRRVEDTEIDEATLAAMAEVKRVEASPFGSYAYCQTCNKDLGKILNPAQIVAHLREAHDEKRAPNDISATREMGMHLDGSNWYGGTYTLTIQGSGVVITETYRYRRSKSDQAYWGLDED